MADNELLMKKFNFTIHKYKGEEGYQKPHVIARFQMECIDDDVAYELSEAVGQALPFNGFVNYEEVPSVLDMPDHSGAAAIQP